MYMNVKETDFHAKGHKDIIGRKIYVYVNCSVGSRGPRTKGYGILEITYDYKHEMVPHDTLHRKATLRI